MTSHLTIPGSLEWDSPEVERLTIATLRYAGGSEHDVRYVSERDYDAALAREAALREELELVRKAVPNSTLELVSLQQRLTVAEQRAGELEQMLADVPQIHFEGCDFQGWNQDGSEPFEFTDGLIKKIKSIRMVGWRCDGPRMAAPKNENDAWS